MHGHDSRLTHDDSKITFIASHDDETGQKTACHWSVIYSASLRDDSRSLLKQGGLLLEESIRAFVLAQPIAEARAAQRKQSYRGYSPGDVPQFRAFVGDVPLSADGGMTVPR